MHLRTDYPHGSEASRAVVRVPSSWDVGRDAPAV